MNFLTHLYFSNDSTANNIGLVIGNTAKGNYLSKYSIEILKGIEIDMQIRNFEERNPVFQRSLQRIINTKYSKYASFIINVFYDHLLAKNWGKYSKVSLEEFGEKIYGVILSNQSIYPYKIRKYSQEMISKKWISCISSIEGTHQYLKLLSKTERFTTNLDQALFELIENYQQYNKDFEEYFNALCEIMSEEAQRFNTMYKKEIKLMSA
jgi:acyl carrier protein phosphodiesterase